MIKFARPPMNDDELHAAVKAVFGVDIPRVQVCEDHVAPFTAFSHAFFAKRPNTALWYGARGSGKSYILALLGISKTIFHMCSTTILGGSIHQSNNVYNHMGTMMRFPNAPEELVVNFTRTELLFTNHTTVRPLSASATSVRGPHPTLHLLDEIDEMDWGIYQSSLGQAMKQPNALGVSMDEYVVKSSTWQWPDGTFKAVLDEHREKSLPVYTWCWREVIQPHGWLDPEFIERKRASIPAELWRIEYELGEPAGETSVFDIVRLKEQFHAVDEDKVLSRHSMHDNLWVYEGPVLGGAYAMGVDLAKTKDWTVAIVSRCDVTPARVVAIMKVGRIPWPTIIDKLKFIKGMYGAEMGHDGTGLGSVVSDLLDGYSRQYLFVGEKRKKILNEMIANVENGAYRMPFGNPLFERLKATKIEDVWSQTLVNSHLPDETAAMAVMNAVAQRLGVGVTGRGIARKEQPSHFEVELRQGDSPMLVETVEYDEFTNSGATRDVWVPSL